MSAADEGADKELVIGEPENGVMREMSRDELRDALATVIEQRDENARDLDACRLRLQEARDDRNAWREQHLHEPEAEALAECIRAITRLEEALTASRGPSERGGYAVAPTYVMNDQREDVVPARNTPVGRVLLHLAERFGVQVEPVRYPRVESGDIDLMGLANEIGQYLSRAR